MRNFLSFLKYSYIYLILAVIYIPLIIIVILSFNGLTIKGNVKVHIGDNDGDNNPLAAYTQLSEIWGSLVNSLIIGFVATPVSIFISLATCFGLWNSQRIHSKIVLGVSNFSISSPEVIAGLGLAILFISTFIPMGLSFGLLTIILAHISFCTPYAIVAIYPRMNKINRNWILASYDLGCVKWKTFIKIVIPFLFPAICSAFIIVFTMSFDDFIITNLVRGSTQTLSTQLYLMRKGIKGWAVAFGALLLLIILFFVSIIGIHKYRIQRRKKITKFMNKKK